MNEFSRLVLEVYTPKYLGNKNIAVKAIEILQKQLNKGFYPTKCQDLCTFKKSPFSFEHPQEFINIFENVNSYDSGASLYKVKGIFNFTIWWHKGDADFFKKYPAKKFNSISISVEPGIEFLSNERKFNSLNSIWIEFCETFNATYGYMYIYDFKGINQLGPKGNGLCIPHVYWKTYFGREYTNAFGINPNTHIKDCCVEFISKESVIITLQNSNPKDLVFPNEIERRVKEQLGSRYFWSEKDNWRNPKMEYLMPNIDFSEIIISKE